MKDKAWTDYIAPTDCGWSWKKINLIMQTFKPAYTTNRWLNSSNAYTVDVGYNWLRVKEPKVEWRYLCWNPLNPSKCSFIIWEFLYRKLPTKDRLIKMGLVIDHICPIYSGFPESHDHLVNDCEYAKACTRLLQQHLHISYKIKDLVQWYNPGRKATKLQRRFAGACYVALIYWIWRVRNEARVDMMVRRPDAIVQLILAEVKTSFGSVNQWPSYKYVKRCLDVHYLELGLSFD
ncbi:uncharacterized protein LOC141619256 [Silene latifolia]|uniref:uncharacterized protein LOC141619256 n=1 Tax=Silene latifolia TaxID=37657 RepID=UPI003D785DFD